MSPTSGLITRAFSTASATVVATPATLMSGNSESTEVSPSNINLWSSTRRTLIFDAGSRTCRHLIGLDCRLGFGGQPELDDGAATRRRSHAPPTAGYLRTLAHRHEAEVAGLGVELPRVEALA